MGRQTWYIDVEIKERQTDGQRSRYTDGRTGRQTDGQTDGQTDRQTDEQIAWGIDGWKLQCKLSKKSSDKVGRPNAVEFINFWSKCFSIQLQKCNARVISKKLSSLSEDNRCDLFATQYFSH